RPRQVSRCPLRHGPPGATADWCRASLLSPLSVRSATSHQALLLLPFCNEELTHMTNPTPPPPLPQGFPLSPQAPSGQPVPSQPVSQPLPYAATSSLPVSSGPPFASPYAGPPTKFAALRVAVLVLAIVGFITILPATLPSSVVGARSIAYPLPSITLGQISSG